MVPWLSTYPNFYPQPLFLPEKEGIAANFSRQETVLSPTTIRFYQEREATLHFNYNLSTSISSEIIHIDIPTSALSLAINTLKIKIDPPDANTEISLPAPRIIGINEGTELPPHNAPLWYGLLHTHIGHTIRLDTLHGVRTGILLHFSIPDINSRDPPLVTVVLDEGRSLMGVHSFDISYPPPISLTSSPNFPMKANPIPKTRRLSLLITHGESVDIQYSIFTSSPSFDVLYDLDIEGDKNESGRLMRDSKLECVARVANPVDYDLVDVDFEFVVNFESPTKIDTSCHVYDDAIKRNIVSSATTPPASPHPSPVPSPSHRLLLNDHIGIDRRSPSSPTSRTALPASINEEEKANTVDYSSDTDDEDEHANSFERAEICATRPHETVVYKSPKKMCMKKGTSKIIPLFKQDIKVQVMTSLKTDDTLITVGSKKKKRIGRMSASRELKIYSMKQLLPPGLVAIYFRKDSSGRQSAYCEWAYTTNITRVLMVRSTAGEGVNSKWIENETVESNQSSSVIIEGNLYIKEKIKRSIVYRVFNHEYKQREFELSFITKVKRRNDEDDEGNETTIKKFKDLFDIADASQNKGKYLPVEDVDWSPITIKTVIIEMDKHEPECVIVVHEWFEERERYDINSSLSFTDIFDFVRRKVVSPEIGKRLIQIQKLDIHLNQLKEQNHLVCTRKNSTEKKFVNLAEHTHNDSDSYEDINTLIGNRQKELDDFDKLCEVLRSDYVDTRIQKDSALKLINNVNGMEVFNENGNEMETVEDGMKTVESTLRVVNEYIEETEQTNRQLELKFLPLLNKP